MLAEAGIAIGLVMSADRVAEVRIASTRRTDVAALFVGRSAEQVLALLPTLFALCGTAQTLAGLAAIEAATGQSVVPAQIAARRLLVLAEMVAEHGTAIARDWPKLVGAEPQLGLVKELRAALIGMRLGLYPAGDWKSLGGGALQPDRRALMAALDAAESVIDHLPVERLIETITRDCPDFGRSEFRPMPAGGPPDLGDRMIADSYLSAPDHLGVVFETGALARWHRHPRLAAHGNGLSSRFVARQVEIAESLAEMRRLAADVTTAAPTRGDSASGMGLGVIEATRGLLAHRVEMDQGRVRSYRILAPTEWNFHRHGVLMEGLLGASDERLSERAEALVAGLDPCVAATVTLE